MTPLEELLQIANNKPSDVFLPDVVNAAIAKAGTNLTDAEKIAAFDKIAQEVRAIWGQSEEAYNGKLFEDSDSMHYLYEAALKAVFGENVFAAFNKLFESC